MALGCRVAGVLVWGAPPAGPKPTRPFQLIGGTPTQHPTLIWLMSCPVFETCCCPFSPTFWMSNNQAKRTYKELTTTCCYGNPPNSTTGTLGPSLCAAGSQTCTRGYLVQACHPMSLILRYLLGPDCSFLFQDPQCRQASAQSKNVHGRRWKLIRVDLPQDPFLLGRPWVLQTQPAKAVCRI